MSKETDIVEALYEAFGVNDWARLEALLAADMTYEEIGTGRQVQGAAAFLDLCHGWKQAFPDVTSKLHNIISSGSDVVIDVTWTGTHSGPLELPTGPLAATGRTVEFRGLNWVAVHDGHVTESRNYLDALGLLGQLRATGG